MNAYDFLLFSPSEFELFVKDLLETHWNIHIEAFADGADGGIDLRYKTPDDKTGIIQCKRYKATDQILTSLKKEAPRISRLAPYRYIIVTASDLTGKAKQKLVKLFYSVGLREEDIIGSKDLNKILSRHPEVEDRFFKLWIRSTNVLKNILKRRVHNYSQFEKAEIERLAKFYVPNKSFDEALGILTTNRCCIISGIPGIGKSTLTRILACYLLSKGFEELVCLSSGFSDAWEYYDPTKKQLFIFDDFLGKVVLEGQLQFNEDSLLMSFIEQVRRSPNTLLILATRENILNLAKMQYESLNDPRLDLSKCILEVGKYTSTVRALILYNQLYYSEMPQEFIDHLLKDRFYLKLLNHRNYSPRIIDMLISKGAWKTVAAKDIQQLFLKSLEHAHFVWKHAFEQQIKPLSRCLLLVMVSCGDPILLEDIRKALQRFLAGCGSNYDASYSHPSFDHAIKELHNCFITTIPDSKGFVAVTFQNPSVQDFLLYEVASDSRIIDDIVSNAYYLNQILFGACWNIPSHEEDRTYLNWTPDISRYAKIDAILETTYHVLPFYSLRDFNYNERKITWLPRRVSPLESLSHISNFVKEAPDHAVHSKKLLIRELQAFIDSCTTTVPFSELDMLMELLELYGKEASLDEYKVVQILENSLEYFAQLVQLRKLESALPNAYHQLVKDTDRLLALIRRIYEKESASSFQEYDLDILNRIAEIYQVDVQDIRLKITKDIPRASIGEESRVTLHKLAALTRLKEDLQGQQEIDLIFSSLASSSDV